MKAFVTVLFISFFLFDVCLLHVKSFHISYSSAPSIPDRVIQYDVFSIVCYAIKVQIRTNCYKKA